MPTAGPAPRAIRSSAKRWRTRGSRSLLDPRSRAPDHTFVPAPHLHARRGERRCFPTVRPLVEAMVEAKARARRRAGAARRGRPQRSPANGGGDPAGGARRAARRGRAGGEDARRALGRDPGARRARQGSRHRPGRLPGAARRRGRPALLAARRGRDRLLARPRRRLRRPAAVVRDPPVRVEPRAVAMPYWERLTILARRRRASRSCSRRSSTRGSRGCELDAGAETRYRVLRRESIVR